MTGCQHVYVAHDRTALLADREMRDFVGGMSDENGEFSDNRWGGTCIVCSALPRTCHLIF